MARMVTVSRWGSSLAVRIPFFMAERLELTPGFLVKVWPKDNFIIIEAPKTPRKEFEEWIDGQVADEILERVTSSWPLV